jgi:2-oxoglutarate ferredoxin oxidoreductase subunit beta
VQFKSVPENYDPTDRRKATSYLMEQQTKGEIVTGLLYMDETVSELHEMNRTPDVPLARLPYEKLCPGKSALDTLQEEFR